MLIAKAGTGRKQPEGPSGGMTRDEGLWWYLTQLPGQEAVQCIQAEIEEEERQCHMGPRGSRDGT